MNTINQKQEIQDQEVYTWSFTLGDFNDVFDKKTLKGTWDQVEQYCKDQFNEDIRKDLEDIGSDGICFAVYYPDEIDPETNEPYEDQELRIELYAEAITVHYLDNEIDIDLTVVTE